MDDYKIRQAEESDCGGIVKLIKELAEFEKMSNKVKITEEVLRRDGFGENKYYECLVAEHSSKDNPDIQDLVGYALYYFVYSTFEGRALYLEDIYVTPKHRGKTIGTNMWKRVAKIAIEKECQRLDFVVLDWNEKAQSLYRSKGAQDLTVSDKWHLWRMDRNAMEHFVKS